MITEPFKVWLGYHHPRYMACSGVHVTTIGVVKSSTRAQSCETASFSCKMRDPRFHYSNCSDMNTRASHRRGVMRTKPNFERFRDHEPHYYCPRVSHGLDRMSRNRNIGRPARQRLSTLAAMTIQAVSRRVLSDLSRSVVTLSQYSSH